MRIKVGDLYFGLRNDGFANVVGIDRENYLLLEEELTIPDKVEYKDRNYIVNSIDNYAFSNLGRIKKFVIPKTVLCIGEHAFYCSGLEKIVFLHDEGSEISIGNQCFCDCRKLEEISLPEGVTSIKKQTFCGCIRLKRVNLPNTLAKIEYSSFYGCTDLEKIIIPGSVKLIGDNAFSLCIELIGNIYFQGIPPRPGFMGDLIFPTSRNKELNTIHINPEYFSYFISNPSFNKFSFLDNEGTSIESAIYFIDKKNKTAVVIPKLDKYCSNMYRGTVYIQDKIVQKKIEYIVTGIEEFAFSSCPDLKRVISPSSLKLGPLDIIDSGDCKIEYYEIPSEKDQDSYI